MEGQFPTPNGRRSLRLAEAEAFAWAEALLGVVHWCVRSGCGVMDRECCCYLLLLLLLLLEVSSNRYGLVVCLLLVSCFPVAAGTVST